MPTSKRGIGGRVLDHCDVIAKLSGKANDKEITAQMGGSAREWRAPSSVQMD
jgi:hypothetical protein